MIFLGLIDCKSLSRVRRPIVWLDRYVLDNWEWEWKAGRSRKSNCEDGESVSTQRGTILIVRSRRNVVRYGGWSISRSLFISEQLTVMTEVWVSRWTMHKETEQACESECAGTRNYKFWGDISKKSAQIICNKVQYECKIETGINQYCL